MIEEYNLVEGDEEFIDGSMELGTASPLEMNEIKMNEGQFRNLVYEMTLKMLDEELNEDGPAAPVAAPMDQATAGGAPMDPAAAAAGVMPSAAPEDADKNPYKDKADKKKEEIAKKAGDNTGGAPGFNPQGPDDEQKKQLAKRVAESILRQIKEQYKKKK